MREESYTAKRVDRLIDRDFPTCPTLSATARCSGMAFVQRSGAPRSSLRALRDNIREIRCGLIDTSGDMQLLLVTFLHPMQVDGDAWPDALPLAASGTFTLRSFAMEQEEHTDPSRLDTHAIFRRIELWWGGRLHRIAIDTLAPLSIATLWDMPRLDIHSPTPPAADRTSTQATPAMMAGRGPLADGIARVSHAAVPIDNKVGDRLSGMTADLHDQHDRMTPAAILRDMRDRLFSSRLFGETGEGNGTPGSPPASANGPGLLSSIMGWLRWHTPLGDPLRKQFNARIDLVERMIAANDIDGALKLALRLGGGKLGEKSRIRYPNRLPGRRSTLDFDLASPNFTMPIMGDAAFLSLNGRYRQLADQLERQGDFHRAAYIRSQLLGDHRGAVLTLEAGELYRDGAKLALDARLDPSMAIRLFFKAGELSTALALAKRADCFEELAEDSRDKGHDYHAYVIRAWTDMLLATGQPLRALQVTDHLTTTKDVDPALLALRRDWIELALHDTAGDGFDTELMVRTLTSASWTADDISPRGLESFPYMPSINGSGPFPAVLEWLQIMLRGDVPDARDTLLDLLNALMRIANTESIEQAAFWRGPALPVIETFARSLIELASNGLSENDLQIVHALLAKANLQVMATDVRKLSKLHSAPIPAKPEWHIPSATTTRPAIKHACLLSNGHMLVWRESRLLELLDGSGTALWRQNISDVVGLVSIGSSPNAIVIQAQRDGTRSLTRFSSRDRMFNFIGNIDLIAHHDITSESQWLVQIGGKIGALDLAKLCMPTPEIEFLWSCALTDRLNVVVFAHYQHATCWLTRDVSHDRYGIVELWSLRPSGELTTSICMPAQPVKDEGVIPPGDWHWDKATIGSTHDPKQWMRIMPWSEMEERRAQSYYAAISAAGIDEVDRFQPLDFGRSYVRTIESANDEEGIVPVQIDTSVVDSVQHPSIMTLRHGQQTQLTCLARGCSGLPNAGRKARPSPGVVLFGDNHGRLFIVSGKYRRVTTI